MGLSALAGITFVVATGGISGAVIPKVSMSFGKFLISFIYQLCTASMSLGPRRLLLHMEANRYL